MSPATGGTGPLLTGPLVSVDLLAAVLDEPRLRLVDCRWYLGKPGEGRLAYEAGHLPGAIHVDVDTDLTAPTGPGRHPLPDPGVFRERMAALGIGDEHMVVAYDDQGGWVATRLWWMLESLGHRAVAVLDGGIQAWTASGRSLTIDVVMYPQASLTLADRWSRTIERDELVRSLGHVVLLDARAATRYRGEIEPIDAVAGHIPTARNAPVDGNLAHDGRFLPPADLAARYAKLGAAGDDAPAPADATGDSGVVVSCGSGVSATHLAFAMRVAGLPDPRLYPGSYSDWTQSGLPVATGPEPGDPPE